MGIKTVAIHSDVDANAVSTDGMKEMGFQQGLHLFQRFVAYHGRHVCTFQVSLLMPFFARMLKKRGDTMGTE